MPSNVSVDDGWPAGVRAAHDCRTTPFLALTTADKPGTIKPVPVQGQASHRGQLRARSAGMERATSGPIYTSSTAVA